MFALLADIARLGAHMGRRLDAHRDRARHSQAIGSVIGMSGWVLELPLPQEEAVVERAPPLRNTWEPLCEHRLPVIGRYRMGFDLAPAAGGACLHVWIDNALPAHGLPHLLGRLFGRVYADWCVRQMLREETQAFGGGRP